MAADELGGPVMSDRDGSAWQIGAAVDVGWIAEATRPGLAITSAIPPVFKAYGTIVLPDPNADDEQKRERHDQALLDVLKQHSANQPWWLGYLDTGGHDVIFPDAPMVTLYVDWHYVLVKAGPEQAAAWRERDPWKGALPDLMFPADRSWLVSTLWDDDWTCIGGSDPLLVSLEGHPDLQARSRRVTLEQDATPPGHEAR
jgi:hypothetical protein